MTKHFLILGADGATGSRVLRQALDAGHRVRAGHLGRKPPGPSEDRLEWVRADLLAPDGLAAAVSDVDAVLCAVGIDAGLRTSVSPPKLHTRGTLNLIRAMRSEGVDRLVTISCTFVETMDRGPIWFRVAAKTGLRAIFEQMGNMELILQATETLRWTAVRPGWLLDEGPTDDYAVFDRVIPPDLIRTRTGDLAHFMLRCAVDDLHIRETPAIARPEDEDKSGPDAILREMIR